MLEFFRRIKMIVAITLAAATSVPVGALADATLFKERCAKCHARASSLASNLKGQTKSEKATLLNSFLSAHHAEDVEERQKIVSYLVGLAR